jgi:hypothetical protein
MSRVEAAPGMDRLPWLPDEPQPRPVKRRGNSVLAWASAAVLALAAGGFWLATRSVNEPLRTTEHSPAPATTVQLPIARPAEPQDVRLPPQRDVRPSPAPQVRPAPERELRIPLPSSKKAAASDEVKSAPPAQQVEEQSATSPAVAAAAKPFVMPKPWNPRVFAGAAGRVVQIGAFGSVTQAKRGWWYMVRAYPAVAHLPAVVRPARNSKGRTFYRFQVGTTSQAHSEVLCQRMEHIRFSCAVVGLPWKAKVER